VQEQRRLIKDCLQRHLSCFVFVYVGQLT